MNVTACTVALSVGLGMVLVASAVPKLRHPRGFVLTVLLYRVLPPRLGEPMGWLIPPLELLTALLLLSGAAVRLSAGVASGLLASFMVAVGINVARHRNLDCGCFGGALRRRVGWPLLVVDAMLLGAAIALTVAATAWLTPEPWSVWRLWGLAGPSSVGPLIGCVVVTACAVAVLGRAPSRRSWFDRSSHAGKQTIRREREIAIKGGKG
jgi:hypothetical protein